jgi:hypothetical protein
MHFIIMAGREPFKIEMARKRFDAFASKLGPSRGELDGLVKFVHDRLSNDGLTSGHVVEHILENLNHRVEAKYPGKTPAYVRRQLRGAISKKLFYLKKSGAVEAKEAGEYTLHFYPGVRPVLEELGRIGRAEEVAPRNVVRKPKPAPKPRPPRPRPKPEEKRYTVSGHGTVTLPEIAKVLENGGDRAQSLRFWLETRRGAYREIFENERVKAALKKLR